MPSVTTTLLHAIGGCPASSSNFKWRGHVRAYFILDKLIADGSPCILAIDRTPGPRSNQYPRDSWAEDNIAAGIYGAALGKGIVS